MSGEPLEVGADVGSARTLPSAVYHEPGWFDRQREAVFARSWIGLEPGRAGGAAGEARPWTLLPGCLDEPVVSTFGGVASRLYDRGRYVPGWESGVHHFHRLLAGALS